MCWCSFPKKVEKVMQSTGSKSGCSVEVAAGWSHKDWLRMGFHGCLLGKSNIAWYQHWALCYLMLWMFFPGGNGTI